MVRVTLSGHTLAESTETIVVENNHYFPPDSVNKAFLTDSTTSSVCTWKGNASYYNAEIKGNEGKETLTVEDVAWYYPEFEPKEKAKDIKDYVAFYKSKVEISELDK